jgi:ATP-dependent protease HslVU (ClpYQ) peptidase subunit
VRQVVEDPFMAWGSGRDFALGAMAMGATAREAVAVACRFNVYCGNGIDAFDLK